MGKILDIEKWRIEIQIAESHRKDNFGEYTNNDHSRVGENIDYFDYGFSALAKIGDPEMLTTLNLIHSIVKNIVPTIAYKNPVVHAAPKKPMAQDVAPIVGQTVNYYYDELDIGDINKDVAWDAYVLGHGYSKVGYATKFGMDVKDEKKKPKSVIDRGLEKIGLKKKEEKVEHPEVDYTIISERPYVAYVSPFDFLSDPRGKTLNECMWVGQQFRKTVKEMKENKKYKNTSKLQGSEPSVGGIDLRNVSQSEIEDFRFVDLYELHYRTEDGIYILVLSKDDDVWAEHYHELSPYNIEGWQFDELTFNKHRHKKFTVSDITKLRSIQDRFNSTMEAIMEQVDRYVPKIAYDEGSITVEGEEALRNGDVGAIVKCTKNPNEVIKELQLTQLKADLKALLEHFIDIVSITTGLTRSQIMGVSTAETATAETIAQGGYTLRITEMNDRFNRFAKKQVYKLWDIITQFVDLEELDLINGVTGYDETTGAPKYTWLSIGPDQAERMAIGDFNFEIEVGSTQRAEQSVIRKQFENLFSILARSDVIMLMQQQGDKVVLSELLKMYVRLFPEAIADVGKIIQKITPETSGLIPPEPGPGGTTSGSNFNQLEAQAGQATPDMPSMMGV